MLPPPSQVPRRSDGTLVRPAELALPSIPARSYEGWPDLPAVELNRGAVNHNAVMDYSAAPPKHVEGKAYTVLVPQVDADGNEIAGIRLPELDVPRGTHTGWSLLKPGNGGPDICGQMGQFIPFARTPAERFAAGDPRPSIEERYSSIGSYIERIAESADRLVSEGFLLEEDRERIVGTCRARGFTPSWSSNADRSDG